MLGTNLKSGFYWFKNKKKLNSKWIIIEIEDNHVYTIGTDDCLFDLYRMEGEFIKIIEPPEDK